MQKGKKLYPLPLRQLCHEGYTSSTLKVHAIIHCFSRVKTSRHVSLHLIPTSDPDASTFSNKDMHSPCFESCFELSVRDDTTLLEAYNCDRQKPGQKTFAMPAEKQIYRADYVKQHFVHYSTVTETTNLPLDQYLKKYKRKIPSPDPLSRFIDEVNEGLMLHSKAIARQDTAGWKRNCHKDGNPIDQCRIGFPWPEDGSNRTNDDEGWKYNCYVNPRIDNYWSPLLKNKLKEMGFLK
jgi:hypothetical protein